MNEQAPAEMTGGGVPVTFRGQAQQFLRKHSKIVSVLIVVAVIAPVIAVTAQVTPVRRNLPAATDFRMMDVTSGSWIRLSDYAEKPGFAGKVVLIDFMATWCTTCKASMPDLLQINWAFSSKPFVLLSVTASPTDNVTLMNQFRTTYSANWTFAIPFDVDVVGQEYGVSGFPTYVIVDRVGQITFRVVGLVPLSTLTSHIDETLAS